MAVDLPRWCDAGRRGPTGRSVDGGASVRSTGLLAAIDRLDFATGFGAVWELIRATNSYIEDSEPWKLNKAGDTAATAAVLGDCLEALRVIALLASPVIPHAAGRALEPAGPARGSRGPAPSRCGHRGHLPAGLTVEKGALALPADRDRRRGERADSSRRLPLPPADGGRRRRCRPRAGPGRGGRRVRVRRAPTSSRLARRSSWPRAIPTCVATVGLHPHDASRLDDEWDASRRSRRTPRSWPWARPGSTCTTTTRRTPRRTRRSGPRSELAHRLERTLVIHSREAWDRDVPPCSTTRARPTGPCSTASPAGRPRRCVPSSSGAYLSFSGIVTFKNADDLRAAAAVTPLERLLVETDSPYLAPCRTGAARTSRRTSAWSARLSRLRPIGRSTRSRWPRPPRRGRSSGWVRPPGRPRRRWASLPLYIPSVSRAVAAARVPPTDRPIPEPTITEPQEPSAPQPGRRSPYTRHVRRPHRLSRRHVAETVKESPARAEPHDADELAARPRRRQPSRARRPDPGLERPGRPDPPGGVAPVAGPQPAPRPDRLVAASRPDALPSVEDLLTREPWTARPSPARAEPHDANSWLPLPVDLDALPGDPRARGPSGRAAADGHDEIATGTRGLAAAPVAAGDAGRHVAPAYPSAPFVGGARGARGRNGRGWRVCAPERRRSGDTGRAARRRKAGLGRHRRRDGRGVPARAARRRRSARPRRPVSDGEAQRGVEGQRRPGLSGHTSTSTASPR